MKIIGLIPAAGHATRLGALLTGSKELVPITIPPSPARPVCEYLLLQMQRAGIDQVVMVIRAGKRDIRAHLADGAAVGLNLSYIVTATTASVPHTLDRAYPIVRDAIVVLGFPDILVHEPDCLARLVQEFRARPVDVLLCLFPIGNAHTMDAVEMHGRHVHRIIPKPGPTALTHTWAYAVWGERFSAFLHDALAALDRSASTGEIQVADVMQDAITNRFTVDGIVVSARPFLDIGTPAGLRAAQRPDITPA